MASAPSTACPAPSPAPLPRGWLASTADRAGGDSGEGSPSPRSSRLGAWPRGPPSVPCVGCGTPHVCGWGLPRVGL